MKKIYLLIVSLILLLSFVACNYNILDTNWSFDHAYLNIGGDWKYIEIKSWTDADGEQLTVIAKDGTVYEISSINCTLVKEAK